MGFSHNHLIISFLVVFIPYANSIAFNFPNITPKYYQDIQVSGNGASITDDGIQVTPERDRKDSNRLAGRATYVKQLHLWDNVSNDLASFSTNFTFVIDSYGSASYADGLTFFLAENNTIIPGGGAIGLPFDIGANATKNRFVAVEFDTFWNNWDPKDPETNVPIDEHVGININSITSVKSRKWLNNITVGNECVAMINYYSETSNLSVSFTSFKDNLSVWETGLDYTIDLRDVLPEFVIFGFSASTGKEFQKNNVKSWMFTSTEFKVDENNKLGPTVSPKNINQSSMLPPTTAKSEKKKISTLRNLGLIAGTLSLVTVLCILAYFLWRRKKIDKVEELGLALEMNKEFEMGPYMPRSFSYGELARSTADFAETEKLGEGGFGGVYKGFLIDLSTHVAVKRVSKTSKQGIKEYASEVKIISRLRHRNLVQLIGWCHDQGELLLVYEFMENGSLDLHLFKGKSLLTWDTRYKIAHDLASALLYLHEEWEQCVLHRDIKSSNIMLDSKFNAKLGDFGLAKLVDHEKGSDTTMLAGTLGYMAPECVITGRATKESDVYSFGIVALEIACGRKAIDYKAPEKQIRLLEWVWELYGTGTLLEAADPKLESAFEEEEIKRLMTIGLWCGYPDSELRPSMRQALKVLNFEASLPLLPSKMPVASYLTPSMSSFFRASSINKYQVSSSDSTESSKQTTSSTISSSSSSSSSQYVSLLHSMK